MKILKLVLFQETACFKKPFSLKVAETYPLPPYSTVIGMLHKVLGANSGEYFPMNISIQGEYDSIFSNYQNLRMFKGKDKVTSMPRNVHQLLDVKSVIHVKSEDNIIDMIYENIVTGKETFTLGRNEDIVRVDEIKIVTEVHKEYNKILDKYNMYIPTYIDEEIKGIGYRLNTTYKIKDGIRKWDHANVKYVEKEMNEGIYEVLVDEDGDCIMFYDNENEPHLV